LVVFKDKTSFPGCMTIKDMPKELQSVFRKIGLELSYLESKGSEVRSLFRDWKRRCKSGVQASRGIGLCKHFVYN
jgi:hypothetical protein